MLRERNVSVLRASVESASGNDLSVGQFAGTYGQTPANISALTSYLAHYGIRTDVYADNVDVSTTGTAGEYDQALSVTQHQYHVPQLAGLATASARYRRRTFTASRSRRCCRTGSRASCWRFSG